jgi:hypothetical protein
MIELKWIITEQGCWRIVSHKPSDKRGRVLLGKPAVMAHRFMYAKYHGPIPGGVEVCHKCDNPWCINPDHLFIGTHSENMQDMVRKGRGNNALGEHHGNSKLTEVAVADILSSSKSQNELAKKYGVTSGAIYHVRHGLNWSWLPREKARKANG